MMLKTKLCWISLAGAVAWWIDFRIFSPEVLSPTVWITLMILTTLGLGRQEGSGTSWRQWLPIFVAAMTGVLFFKQDALFLFRFDRYLPFIFLTLMPISLLTAPNLPKTVVQIACFYFLAGIFYGIGGMFMKVLLEYPIMYMGAVSVIGPLTGAVILKVIRRGWFH